MALALISGGSGMIGKALTRLLLDRGHQVVILTRDPLKKNAITESAVWDGIHPGLWMDRVNQADWIINLAGENIGGKRWTQDYWRAVRESRIFSGELLTEAVRRASHKPTAMLQMSAIGYYGTQDVNDVSEWDEKTPPGNDRLAAVCREWEASSAKVEGMGVRRLIIRTGLVLNKNAGVLPRLELPFRFLAGGPMGNGRQVYSWIHVADLVNAMLYLLEKPDLTGAFNLTAPGPVSNAEFSQTIGQVLRRPSWLPVPGFVLKFVLGEMSTLVIDGQRVIPKRLQEETGFHFTYPDIQSALENIYQRT